MYDYHQIGQRHRLGLRSSQNRRRPRLPFYLGLGFCFLQFYQNQSLSKLCKNGVEEFLQRDQGDESEGIAQLREADAVDRLREEVGAKRSGQLQCQVHPDQLYRSSLPCLLRWDDLLLPCRSSRGTSPSRAPAARQGAWSLIFFFFKRYDCFKCIVLELLADR